MYALCYLAPLFQVRLSPVLAGAEICRRCVWSFLRLENEHLHVCVAPWLDGTLN